MDPKGEKIRKSDPSIKIIIGLVVVSWGFIIYYWVNASEATKLRAKKYYDEGNKMDQPLPEEFRSEYIDI